MYLYWDLKPGEENGEVAWYADPHALCKVGGEKYQGTFRSPDCTKSDLSGNNRGMCVKCSAIENMRSFRKRVKERTKLEVEGQRDTRKIRNDYLNRKESIDKLRNLQKTVEKLESQHFFAKCQVARLKIKLKSTGEKLKELSRRGSIKAIGLQLEKAASEGKLAEGSFMHDFISTFARNLHVQKQGKRFKPSQRELYEVLLYLGGPRLVKFHAANFGGPDLHTVFKWRQENL